jgi:RND family efflux transporter MFP subunit
MLRLLWRRFAWVVGLVAAVPLAFLLLRPTPAPAVVQAPAVAVATTPAEMQTGYHWRRSFVGQVQPARVSPLAFELGGQLVAVHVQEGESVTAGALLAEVDTERLQAQLRELRASLSEAEAGEGLARSTYRRLARVVDEGAATRQRVDEAEEALRAAEARVVLVQSRIESLEVDLDKSRLTAPYDGVLIERLADEGSVLQAGQTVLVLQEAARPEIRVGIAGRLVDDLQVGEIYRLQDGADGFEARLRTVLPVRDTRARTVNALFDPLGEAPALRPGDLVRLELSERIEATGFWVDTSALTESERGLWGVYVAVPAEAPPTGLIATHRIVRRSVELLYTELDRAYVRGTLSAGDYMLTGGVQRVVPGQWVRLAEAPGDE